MSDKFKIEINPTERGFLRADFEDHNGQACSIQESSLATEDCIWLGQNEGTHHHGHCLARMHLTREMARALVPLLMRFVNRGTLAELSPEEQLSNLQAALKESERLDIEEIQMLRARVAALEAERALPLAQSAI